MPEHACRHRLIALSQVYPPDPASLGQHLFDATKELARRGQHVKVFTANRGYADPRIRFQHRESSQYLEVVRLPFSSFGKTSLITRALGAIAFLVQATVRGTFTRNVGTVLVTTSPPMGGVAGVLLAHVHRAQLVYWVMDVNPDQAIALGLLQPRSVSVRMQDWANRLVLHRADAVVVMDRFMARRLRNKVDMGDRLHVIPPWSHVDEPPSYPRTENPFRAAHDLHGKFVVMYSGNHSNVNPLTTLIAAARALESDPRIVFVFVGAGVAKHEVEQSGLRNLVSLPYVPLEQLGDSLSAADLHVVTMGDGMIGIVHACKIYGAFSVARPVLFFGPQHSHVADYLDETGAGWRVAHGDVEGAVRAIRTAATLPPSELAAMGEEGRELIRRRLSKHRLCNQLCDVVTGRQASAAG